jgi:hypothetical protein
MQLDICLDDHPHRWALQTNAWLPQDYDHYYRLSLLLEPGRKDCNDGGYEVGTSVCRVAVGELVSPCT